MLIKCSECGKEVSDKASHCPNCGNPIADAKKEPENEKNNTKQAAPVVIPKMYTNVTLEDEKAKIYKKIDEIENRKINLEQSLDRANSVLIRSRDSLRELQENEKKDREEQQRNLQELRNIANLHSGTTEGGMDLARLSLAEWHAGKNPWRESIDNAYKRVREYENEISSIKNQIAECNRELVSYNSQLRALDDLLQKTPEQRAEDHYQRLLDMKKAAANDINGLLDLAKKFRELQGYKDTDALAKECENIVKKTQYNKLVQAKNRASDAGEFRNLAQQFRAMNGYENTAELADECDKKYKELKESREEQERIEKEERERREAEERERLKREEEEQKAKKIAKEKRNAMIFWSIFIIVIAGGLLFSYRQKNINKQMMREFTTVSAQVMPVHEGPSADYKPVDEIQQNGKVEILERENGSTWVKISYGGGKTGYADSGNLWRAPGLYDGEIYKGNRDLSGAVSWINWHGKKDGQYTIVLGKDEEANGLNLDLNNMKVDIILTATGAEGKTVRYKKQPTKPLFTVKRGINFIMEEGVHLEGIRNLSKSMINVEDGIFRMNGGSIMNNGVPDNGGAVFIGNGTFIMNNGIIQGNASAKGGGVYMNSGFFIMNNGAIRGNTAYEGGGGVMLNGGTFTMNDGTITENTVIGGDSGKGGGIFIGKGDLILINGTISENSSSGEGGGIAMMGRMFTMNGGTIAGNTAKSDGGGVAVIKGNFTMNTNNGIIRKNTGMRGGGVWVMANSVFIKTNTGGIIYGSNAGAGDANKASRGGQAVHYGGDDGKKRNTTLWTTQTMDSGKNGAAGGWQ